MNMQRLDLTEHRHPGGVAVVGLSGELDIATAHELDACLSRLMADGHPRIVIDTTELRLCDASGIGALLRARTRVGSRRGWLRLAGVGARLHTILKIFALLGVLPEYDDVSSAMPAGVSSGSNQRASGRYRTADSYEGDDAKTRSKRLIARAEAKRVQGRRPKRIRAVEPDMCDNKNRSAPRSVWTPRFLAAPRKKDAKRRRRRGSVKSFRGRKITIGSEVHCLDGRCGSLQQVVIEPVEGVVTHLIVESNHRGKAPYLIPIEAVVGVDQGKPGRIQLRCTIAELRNFEGAHARHFLAGASGQWGYQQEQMLSWPHYRLGRAASADSRVVRAGKAASPTAHAGPRTPIHHHAHRQSGLREVDVRRGDQMWATDGPLGRVQGLVVDGFDRHVTHVLLDEGEIWGQKRAAIPIDSIATLRELIDGVQVDLTREQVDRLPPIELDVQE